MPTFVVTMCGVLEDDYQDNRLGSEGGTHRLTAFDIPFMAGERLCLELEGQGMVVIERKVWSDCDNLAGACSAASMSEFPTLTGYYRLLFLYVEPCK